jgi:Xaa-Pro aminopeptidase
MSDTMNVAQYQARCQAVLARMLPASVLVLYAAPEVIRNRDAHFPFRQDSHFYYLSGFTEPESMLILLKDREGMTSRHLLCRSKNEERELWEGFRWGEEAAKERFGFDGAASIETAEAYLKPFLEQISHLYVDLATESWAQQTRLGWLSTLLRLRRQGQSLQLQDALPLIETLRRRKEADELVSMRRAATISAEAHCLAMRTTRPGKYEYEIEAVWLQHCLSQGAHAVAYPSIVAGGANACILHYRDNASSLNDGELLLIDAGCEYEYYASDITRTFPVNGRFNAAQRDLYTIVLKAQETVITELRPGITWEAYQQITLRAMVEGLKDIGLCKGSVDEIIESGDYKRFYMHRAGHWLGLDVHDAGAYLNEDNQPIVLEPGMVLTVEPGCYVRPSDATPEAFWNNGIRIEDDVLITETGCEVLTSGVPKTIEAVEAMCASR